MDIIKSTSIFPLIRFSLPWLNSTLRQVMKHLCECSIHAVVDAKALSITSLNITTLSITTLCITILSITIKETRHSAYTTLSKTTLCINWHYAERQVFIVMLSDIILIVIILNAFMLSVVAPSHVSHWVSAQVWNKIVFEICHFRSWRIWHQFNYFQFYKTWHTF